MCRADAPPVVDEDVEDAERDDEERSRPFRLESYRYHTARRQSNDGHEEPRDGPCTPDHEPDEQENQQYTTSKQEASFAKVTINQYCLHTRRQIAVKDSLFLAVAFAERRQARKPVLSRVHRITEHH